MMPAETARRTPSYERQKPPSLVFTPHARPARQRRPAPHRAHRGACAGSGCRRRSGPGPAAVCRAPGTTSPRWRHRGDHAPCHCGHPVLARPPAGAQMSQFVRWHRWRRVGTLPARDPGLPALGSAPIALIRKLRRLCRHAPVGVPNGYLCASVLADHGLCSSGPSGGPGGSGASHAASQKGWRALRVHRHSAARVSLTQPPAACIRRSPRRRKGPRSTARTVAGTSGCSPAIPGAR